MSILPKGKANRLFFAALLIVAAPLFAQSEPLGDVARQLRAQHERSGAHAKVWTNEDLGVPETGNPPTVAPDTAVADAEMTGDAAEAKDNASRVANKADAKKAAGAPDNKEAESQKRAQEVNQQYLDRIAAVRAQIDTAQKDLARLQRDQMESTNQFRSSNGTAPGLYEYQTQQRQYQEQIQEQQKLLGNLNQQLDDAREAARHAGVPRASDY